MSMVRGICLPSGLIPIARLPEDFRAKAEMARDCAASEVAAQLWEKAARAVEDQLQEALFEALPLTEAISESGYTRNHLRRLIRDGTVPNSGTESDPRILRMHLPRKPGLGVDGKAVRPASSRVRAARAVIEGDD